MESKKEKTKPLNRHQVQALQPSPFKEAMSFARNRHGTIVSRYLVPTPLKLGRGTMQMVPALDKDGNPLGRVKKEFAPELGIYVKKMIR